MTSLQEILKAFGETTRLRIARLIAKQDLAVNEIVDTICEPQPKISRHLAVLRRAGLAEKRREGNWIYYRLSEKHLSNFSWTIWQAICAEIDARNFFHEDLERLALTLDKREERSREYFEVIQDEWDRIRKHYIDDALTGIVVSSLVTKDAVAADIGTGTGGILLALADSAGKAIGVDRSEKMLKICKKRIKEKGLQNVELRSGDAEKLPIGDEECDTAFCSMLLHHLAEPKVGLNEMTRITKPGGKVVISDLVKHSNDWAREVMADAWLGFSESEIRELCANAGLVNVTYWTKDLPTTIANEEDVKLRAFIATGTKGPSD